MDMWSKLNIRWLVKSSQQVKKRECKGQFLLLILICCLCLLVLIQTLTSSLHISHFVDIHLFDGRMHFSTTSSDVIQENCDFFCRGITSFPNVTILMTISEANSVDLDFHAVGQVSNYDEHPNAHEIVGGKSYYTNILDEEIPRTGVIPKHSGNLERTLFNMQPDGFNGGLPTEKITWERSILPQQYENPLLPFYLKSKVPLDSTKLGSLKFILGIKNPCWFEGNLMLCLPYFYLAGFPKCGTTDIYHKLSIHPDFISPYAKEPHWLTRSRFTGVSMLQYLRYFSPATTLIRHLYTISHRRMKSVITGDLSASTLWDNDFWSIIPENRHTSAGEPKVTNVDFLLHLNPNVKVIAILRNPVDRLYSDYLYFSRTNKSSIDFHRKVVHSLTIYRNCMQGRSPRSCVYDRNISLQSDCRLRIGLYHIYISDFLKKMPRNNTLFLRLEDHAEKPQTTMEAIFRFLGLEIQTAILQRVLERKIANTRRDDDVSIGPMLPNTRRILNDFYRPFNRKLAILLQDDRFSYGQDTF